MRLLKNKTYRILLLIIAFTTIISIITGTRKYAFHVDELWSYGLSNSYDRPQLCNYSTYQELKDDGYNVWFSANDFKEYLTVQKGETFSYDKVVYNQKNDSHPPLFYAILHTISSLNTDSFSKWYVLSVNIIFFILCQIVLFKLTIHFVKHEKKALLVTSLWSLSLAAMTCVMFMRMYVMLTFFCMLLMLISINILENGSITKKDALILILTNVLGMLTHNYYYVYAFIVTITMIALLIAINKKHTVIYCVCMLLSIGITLLIFPEEIDLVFHSMRGKESMSSIKYIIYSYKGLDQYIQCLLSDYAGINYWKAEALATVIISMFLIAMAVLLYVYVRKQVVNENKKLKDIALKLKDYIVNVYKNKKVLLFLIIVSFIYAEITAKIAPYVDYYQDRYFFVIYPYIPLFFVLIAEWLMENENAKKAKKAKKYMYMAVVILTVIINICCENRYVIKKDNDKLRFKEMVKGSQCVYIERFGFMLNEFSLDFTTADRVFFTSGDYCKEAADAINDIKGNDKSFVIIEMSEDEAKEVVDKLEANYNVKLEYDFSFQYTRNYCVYRIKAM